MTLVINARYLLMSAALSQRLGEETTFLQRLLLGYCVTDEIFGVSVSYGPRLDPVYTWGAFCAASPGWVLGTLLGVLMGSVLPARIVSALSVGLYGMFLAIILPPARKSRVLAVIIVLSMLRHSAPRRILHHSCRAHDRGRAAASPPRASAPRKQGCASAD